MVLSVGDKAPDFRGKTGEGKLRSLADFKGKKLILYFYPMDDTSGCTKEACSLRDSYEKLTNSGFAVLGVSPDDQRSHTAFKGKYNLPFELLVDTDKKILKVYKAWGKKESDGNETEGVLRTTYVIQDGKITHVFEKVDVEAHADQIMKAVK